VALARAGRVKKDKLIRVRDGQAAQDNLLEDREDAGVGADTEGEREDSNGGEGWIFGQHSNTEPNIAPQAVHHFSLQNRGSLADY
jgi:hypothetical protein